MSEILKGLTKTTKVKIPTWPVSLPISPLLASYSESHSTLVTSVTTGNKSLLIRKNSSRALDRLNVSFNFTRAQVDYFLTFFYDTLSGGALRFQFIHPRKLSEIEVSFDPTNDQAFTVTPQANATMQWYEVSFSMVIWN